MNRFLKLTALSSTLLFASVYATGNQATTHEPKPAYAAAIGDCKVVKQIPLNNNATAAWQEMQLLQTKMDKIHKPLRKVESLLSEYGKEIESITRLAIVETEQTVRIDKELLEEQEYFADKMSSLVKQHQADFDALEHYGHEIEKHADAFSAPIEEAFDGLDFDFIDVFLEGESPEKRGCEDISQM